MTFPIFARLNDRSVNSYPVKLFSKFVAAALLLMMLGVPAMACALPDAQLSEAEKTCCREMAGQCGKMDMPNGHSCCQTTVKPQQSAMLKPAATVTFDGLVFAYLPTPLVAAPQPAVTIRSTIRAWRHPPPPAKSPSIEILRI